MSKFEASGAICIAPSTAMVAVEFGFSARRNLTAAKRFLCKALKRHGRPDRIDGGQANREAILL